MQKLQDIQEKIFFESKSILETLSKINSKEDQIDLLKEKAEPRALPFPCLHVLVSRL